MEERKIKLEVSEYELELLIGGLSTLMDKYLNEYEIYSEIFDLRFMLREEGQKCTQCY